MKNILFLNTVQNKACKNRALFLMLALVMSIGNAWGHGGPHYGKAVLQNATGNGTVYLSIAPGSNLGQTGSSNPETRGGTSWITWDCGDKSEGDSKNYYACGKANDGYYYAGWADNSSATSYTGSTTKKSFSTNSTKEGSPTTTTIYGFFKPVTVTAAPGNVYIEATDPSATYNDLAGTVVSFTTAFSNKIGDFTTSESGDARWVISAWTRASASSTTFNYKFVGDGSYGTNNRTLTKTVTLTSKGDLSNPKTCTLTAKYPNPKVITCDEAATDLAIYPIFKATDDEAANIKESTAVFDVKYADNGNNFTATFNNATGGGEWIVTGISVDQAKQKVTVSYTFSGKKIIGTHTAQLTLTANDCNGWNDAEAAGVQSVTITLTAHNEQEAVNEVSVTTTGGVTTEYATWAEGLAAANANAGCTLTLLRNIDLGTITTTNNITKAMTIDLNGKELRAAVNKKEVGILNVNANVAVRIKDSKTGGKIINEHALNAQLRTITVTKGSLTLESGTIAVNNTMQYRYGNSTSTTDGVADVTSVAARAIHQAAGTTVNINGGKVQSKASRNGYGIYQASSASTQRAGTSVLNMSGGEVYSECSNRAYGVAAYGEFNLSGGTVTAKLNSETVNANSVYVAANPTSGDYSIHNYAFAVRMYGGASVTAASCYYGVLNMTGGKIEAINENVHATATTNLHTYGIYFDAGSVNVKTGTASDGSYSQKWAAIGNISGGSINVNNAGTLAYGIWLVGAYNSHDDSHTATQIKDCKIDVSAYQSAYGIYATATVGTTSNSATPNMGACYAGDVELTNTEINATTTTGTTAYALFAHAVVGNVYKNATWTKAKNAGYTQVYDGEYAAAAKITVNSGTYTATSATTTAYAVGSTTRAKTTLSSKTSVTAERELGGNAEAYPVLILHGGTFRGQTGTTTSGAVLSGGHTTIDGGTYTAYSGTTTSRGIYATAGTLDISGVEISASSTTTAYGIDLACGISDYTGFKYYADATLKNLTVTATTRTGGDADAVLMEVTKRPLSTTTYNALYSTNKTDYGAIYQYGEYAVGSKCTIIGGTYTATSATATAYGVRMNSAAICEDVNGDGELAIGAAELTVKNATFTVKANNGKTAYGVWAGGPATIDNSKFTVNTSADEAWGVRARYGKTTISNSTINVTAGTATARGIYVDALMSAISTSNNTTHFCGVQGYEIKGEVELNNNTITAKANGGNTAYAVQVIDAKGVATQTTAEKGLAFAGDHAIAGEAVINGGTYTATASGTTAYAVIVSDPVLQGEATATPTCIINDGKFKGTATSTYADISPNGETGYFVLNGGYYVKDENLDKKLGEGMNKVAVQSGTPEYTEGYRWRVTDNMTGEYVCKIKENSTSYASLEEALQVVNANPDNTWTIIMIANYTLSKGDYVLPANTTLLIPYYSTQTAINGETPTYTYPDKNVEKYEAPSLLYKLTFANGVNMSVYGKIEASAVTYLSNQGLTTRGTGVVSGKYGWLYLNEGSHIDLESGSALYAWGYVTGKGEINAKNGSSVYEDFQMGDWRGGTEESNVQGNTNGLDSKGVFLITHYYYQNIECPITYRAGAQGFAHGGTYMYKQYIAEAEVPTKEAVKMIGTSGAMFLMDPATAGEDTWVRKEYDTETDYVNWTMNSGAKLGSVSLKMDLPMLGSMDVTSSDYVLPITSNFNIIANDGEIQITNHVCFLPGSKLTIKKEGTLTIPSGQRVFFYDQDNWLSYGGYWFNPYYSPSWKVNPRVATIGKNTSVKMPDAEVLVEGLLNVSGAIYTTAGGANIHSTRENAGKVKFNVALPAATAATGETTGSTTLYQWKAGGPKYDGKALNPAWLKNEDGTYSKPTSDNTSAGDTWVYMQSLTSDTYEWTKASEDGCFTIRSTGDTKTYVHPSDWVAVGDVNANHAYPSKDGTRMFVNTEAASTSASCKWWDVNKTPEVIDGTTYYVANNENFDNFGTYYYWDNTTSYWKPKKITVTWLNEEGTKITNGTYGDEYNFNTSPQFFGTNPKKTPTAIEKYDWIGWRDAEGNIYDKNATLPRATSNVTYTAYFNTTKYQYTITFKNDDNSDLWVGLVDAGTTGAELQALFKTKYNEKTGSTVPQKSPSVDKVYTFTGWNTTLATVNGPATYVAQYNATPRKYAVTFMNYDMSVLGTAEVPYGSTPTRATYLEAVAPLKDDPYKPDNSAYLFEFAGWRLYGASSNGFVPVAGDQMYIAQYNQTKKYLIQILDIVDADNTKDSLTINTNGWASSGWPYTINGVKYKKGDRKADRTLVIPYSGQPNNGMPIEVKDKEGNIISSHIYKVFVYDSNTTMSGTDENSIVFVKRDTLRIEGTASAKEIYVAPGAALKVKENSTLDVKKLVLRTTPFEAAILTNNGTIVGQVYYSRIARDTDFHLFAIPAGSNTANVVLSDGTSAAEASTVAPYGNAWQLREYNTARRAEKGDDGANWNNIGWDNIVVNGDTRDTTYSDAPIKASKGYELRSGSKYYREYLFPVTLPTTATSVQVTDTTSAAGAAAGAAHAGWNILCSPYTYIYTAEYKDPARGIKVSWQKQELDGSYSYIQVQPDQIKPAVPFAYQASANGSLDFSADSLFFKAPRKQSAAEALTETEWIHLDIYDAYGDGDETSLFVHPTRFEQTYKTGIDVAKQSLTAPRPIIYSTHAYGDMAFAGVADSLLENGIDIAVYSPSAQQLTFSLRENKFLHRLEYLWLADNETGERTDLLMDDYTCRANAGTIKGRFVLNGRFKAPQISTGIGNTQTDYNIYAIGNNIAISGVEQGTPIYVFDAVGHMIYTTAATSDEVIVPAPCAGVYMLTIGGQTAKLVINQ